MPKKLNGEGVSESIGYVIMFSLIITGIGLVTLYGYPELVKNQISADERNMEQNMITLQNDIKLLTYSNIPYRDTAMRIASGSLTIFDPSPQKYIRITYVNESGSTLNYDFRPGEIRYVSEGGSAVISVENGAVLKRQQLTPGSFMLAQPRWFVDDYGDRTFVIFLLGIKTNGMLTLSGIDNIRMSRLEEPEIIDEEYPAGVTRTVTVRYVDSSSIYNYTKAWDTYFNGSFIVDGGLTPTAPGNSYKLDNVHRIVIKQYNVTIENF